jgi:deazaflavin-dependent oxidoreductase (nitroreductase family)
MLGQVLAIVLVILGAAAALAAVFVVGMRTKSRLVQGPIIWMTKRFINPRQVRTAGQAGASTSIIRNVGRISGRTYDTPVDVVQAGDAFLVALPYGTNSQWVRNVLASGSATILTDGHTYAAERAELVPMASVAGAFPAGDQRGFRLMKTDRCLRLQRATGEVVAAA